MLSSAWLTQQLRLFFIALQFFTRLPIPRWVGFEPAWLQHASRYFPLVGIVVAAVSSGVFALAAYLLPPAIAVLLATIAGIYLTGAFHEDGFADVCDGFGGGGSAERVLEIMKDSRIGAYGAIGIGLMLTVKCATLSHLAPRNVIAALLLAHPLSRLAAVSLIWRLTYVRAEGKAKPLAQHMSNGEFLTAAASACLPMLALGYANWLTWQAIVVSLLCAALATWWLSRIFAGRIGGFTGDCLGAVQQLAEVSIYLGLLAASQHGWAT